MELFYVLESSTGTEVNGTLYHPIEPKYGSARQCRSCGEDVGALHWLPPYRAELELWRFGCTDLAFGGGSDLLISERFKMAYEDWGLTGLEGCEPTEIAKVKVRRRQVKSTPLNYYHVSIERDEARVDDRASGLRRERTSPCADCGSGGPAKFDRIVLVKGTWSGRDVFYARGLPGTILVSQRFEEFYRANNITGGSLIPASAYRYDSHDFSWMGSL